VIFNRGGKPDRAGNEFSRYDPGASWWTIGTILSYIGKYYVEKFSDLTWPDSEWQNVPRANENPGELALGGMTVAEALDSLTQLLGNTAWGVDYADGKVFPVRLDAMPQTVNIRYMVGPGEPDLWTASSVSVNIDGTRGTNRTVVVSGSQQTEAEWNTENNTLRNMPQAQNAIYRKRFVPVPTRADAKIGPALSAGATGRSWTPELITPTGAAIGLPAIEDRSVVWIKHKDTDSPGSWRLVKDGFEFIYDPPAIQFTESITYYEAEKLSRTASAPKESQLALEWDDNLQVRITTTTLTDIHQWAEKGYAGTFNYDFSTYLEQQQLIPQYRLRSVGPDLTVHDGWFADHLPKLQAIADNYAEQSKRTHRELVATLPYPQPLYLGVQVRMVRSDGGSPPINPSTDPLICTGLDWYFEQQQELVVRAENTLGAAYVGLRPVIEDNEVISRWKNSRSPSRLGPVGFRGPRANSQLGVIDSPSGFNGPRRQKRFGTIQ
jgi:hypothetical protein